MATSSPKSGVIHSGKMLEIKGYDPERNMHLNKGDKIQETWSGLTGYVYTVVHKAYVKEDDTWVVLVE